MRSSLSTDATLSRLIMRIVSARSVQSSGASASHLSRTRRMWT